MGEEACSAIIVLVGFFIFGCMTLILGFYGSSTIQLEPNSSRLVKVNAFFVQSIQAEEIHETLPGTMLYGFTKVPPLDVLTTWPEKHDVVVESGHHKGWQYFLNSGSKIHVSYSVKRPSSVVLPLVIAQGGESFAKWIADPLYPNNTTLSWNIIIRGNGTIDLEILSSNMYHIALGNLNLQDVEVQLNFTIEALMYNTTEAYYECSLSNHQLCTMALHLFKPNAAVLASPVPASGVDNRKWYVKLKYCQRWISYFTSSVSITVFVLVVIKLYAAYRSYGAGSRAGSTVTARPPLLSVKDDDLSSWGSSYDSLSEDEEKLNDAVAILNGKQQVGESNNDRHSLCILCLDTFRDCFFLPCGHCASCFTCGGRVIEEGGVCPICRRATRKIRRIFSV